MLVGNKKHGSNGFIWVSFATILLFIFPLACLLSKHLMVMMHPLLSTTFFVIVELQNLRIGLKVLKDNLQASQNQQKQYADQHRVERQFQVNDLVYLRFHPYKQTTIKDKGLKNLKPRFYCPYKVTQKIGEVAYELEGKTTT